jgi:hypothetical protein
MRGLRIADRIRCKSHQIQYEIRVVEGNPANVVDGSTSGKMLGHETMHLELLFRDIIGLFS